MVAAPRDQPAGAPVAGQALDAGTTRGSVWVIVAIVAVVVALLALVAGALGWKYLRLDTIDDYRDGYAIGQNWRAEGEDGECFRVMEAVYGQDASDRPGGWGAFVAGCQDGLNGREEASWYDVRNHVAANSD